MTFLNLTNHPHQNWSPKQLAAAEAFGDEIKIIDFPFPNVEPSATTAQVDAMADEIADLIANQYVTQGTLIHLSGEYTLTVALVARFQGLGYTVLASTSERIVSIDEAGDRHIRFAFAQFREYAPLYAQA